MPLHPLAGRFASVAVEYQRGRPEYPPAVTRALSAELDLQAGARVLDLAAGTGKLSRALLAAELDVVAVEPQEAMRERLAQAIGARRALAGLAESIPLPDATVQAVTVADAFHWFDHAAALSEIARVLCPGGGLAVLTTAWDWSGAPWAHELGSLLAALRPEHPQFDGTPWQRSVTAAGSWDPVREMTLVAPAACDAGSVADYVASMSWIAAMPSAEHASTMARVRALLAGSEGPMQLAVRYQLGVTALRPEAR